MTEQTTIRALAAVARDWGPLWTIATLFAIYLIAEKIYHHRKRSQYNILDKQRDHEIQKLRTARGEILHELSEAKLDFEKRIADIRVELEKRTTYTWMEEKVLPRIDKLTTTVAEFKSTVDLLIKQGFNNKQ